MLNAIEILGPNPRLPFQLSPPIHLFQTTAHLLRVASTPTPMDQTDSLNKATFPIVTLNHNHVLADRRRGNIVKWETVHTEMRTKCPT